MHSRIETDLSRKYLEKIFEKTNDDVCLVGGWAVYASVNERVNQELGRNYIGSRDVDLGFHIDPDWTTKQLRNSPLSQMQNILIDQLGFQLNGNCRYAKWFDSETGKELNADETRSKPLYEIFVLYVDILTDNCHEKINSILKIQPFDEDILQHVFDTDKQRTIVDILDVSAMVPTIPVLLATKLKSIPRRKEEHKRVKDVADSFALVRFSNDSFEEIRDGLQQILSKEMIGKSIDAISKNEYEEASRAIEKDSNEIKSVLNTLMN